MAAERKFSMKRRSLSCCLLLLLLLLLLSTALAANLGLQRATRFVVAVPLGALVVAGVATAAWMESL